MVQKKAPHKLASNMIMLSKPKTIYSPRIDVKNIKGPNLKKKKMKKSGSIKRQEHVKLPGKPKPPPNYMKSTTSSDARKEVSTKISPPPDNSSLRRKSWNNTKLTLASASSVIKCSQVISQRATCSSTLKDSKFPVYLSLNHADTESEGSSIIKVCPYTYCSLNGHRHALLSPLKCFLSARRRTIKAQRGIKLGCLSPRRVKSVFGDGHIFDEKIDDDLESARIITLTEHEHEDFFIDEIFSNKNEDTENYSGIVEIEAEDQEEKVVVEKIPDAPICYEVDNNETLDQEGDVNPKVDEQVFSPVSVREETKRGILSELSVESMKNVQFNEQDSDDEFIFETGNKSRCFDEFSVDEEVSQESFDDKEESFNSGAFSNSDDDGESTDSYDYMESLNNIKTSKPAEVPAAEEPDNITNNLVSHQISSDGGHQVQTELSDAEKNQENSTVSFINSIPIDDQAKEPRPEVSQQKSAKFKAENKAKTETEDSALVLAITKCKKPNEDVDESGPFNPRAPNFLPLEPDPEAEKVDLKHQDMDERKNAKEWMVDYALRQVVTKLGPACKRKVALLVEAFEKVMPIKKCELDLRHTSAFDQARPMQACS